MPSGQSTLAGANPALDGPASSHDNWPFSRAQGGWALLGRSSAIRQLRSQIQRVAPYLRTALVRGETGTGKQAVARAIHAHSSVAAGPFVVRDACALADTAENSGAPARIASDLAAAAHAGTLHLTRIGELNFARQAALLRFLQSFDQLHAINPAHPRAIARTSAPGIVLLAESDRDLSTLAAIGQFRQDLYARLSAVEILVPPLRQRTQDIAPLAAFLLERLSQVAGHPAKRLAETARIHLEERLWPSNLHELEQIIAQAAAMAEGALIEPRHLLAGPGPHPPLAPAAQNPDRLDEVIERHVFDVLTRCGGNKVRAAEALGISRSTLYRVIASPTNHPKLD
jgi:DNA-binding NtrC family response regulator